MLKNEAIHLSESFTNTYDDDDEKENEKSLNAYLSESKEQEEEKNCTLFFSLFIFLCFTRSSQLSLEQ